MPEVLNLDSLTFARHSYALSSDEAGVSDILRPLSEKGVAAAKALDEALAAAAPAPDIILVSDAARALETLKYLKLVRKNDPEIRIVHELYDCSAGQLYNIILDAQEGYKNMLVIGHNPAVSQLYSMLFGEYVGFAPATSRTLLLK
ncbi:histidine phosphatase family protein [bacterium]|nr:histidine phosphatase family protein [bacterium]